MIPLLSKKPLCLWTPEEYYAYIVSLYFKKAPKKQESKRKPFLYRKTKKGFTLKVNRTSRTITPEELHLIATSLNVTEDRVREKLTEIGCSVTQN